VKRTVFAVTALVGIVALVGASTAIHHWRSRSAGALGMPGEGAGGVSLTKDSEMASVGGLMLCLKGKSPVTVTSVTPVHRTGGFVIQAWGIRPSPWRTHTGNGIGAERKPLSAFPGFTGNRVVRARCGSAQPESELAVQVARRGSTTANADALQVNYRIPGRSPASYTVPWRITLCGPQDHVSHCSPKG
jgi:hypothetical protein